MAPLEGPVGVGALFDAIMLGCVVVQSCVYYKTSRNDTWSLKLLVLLVLLLLHSHLGCMIAWLWASTAEGNAGDESMPVPNYSTLLFGVSSICGAVILFLERCFFSHRILKASNNHLLAFVFFVCCIFSFTTAFGAACIFFTDATAYLTSQLSSSWIFPLVIISGLVCDLAINIATGLFLKSQTPTEVADALGHVARMFLLVVETGSVSSVFGVTSVIVYWLTRSNSAWVGLYVVMPGVFANTLLAALNARGKLCADIEHQRAFGDNLIDKRVKRPPILISISTQAEKKQSEKSPV